MELSNLNWLDAKFKSYIEFLQFFPKSIVKPSYNKTLKMFKTLWNVYLKHRSKENRLAFKKQLNFCVSADYLKNFDINLVRDKK